MTRLGYIKTPLKWHAEAYELFNSGSTAEEIANIYHVKRPAVWRAIRAERFRRGEPDISFRKPPAAKPNPVWDAEEQRIRAELRAEGLSSAEIAEALGRSRMAVTAFENRNGLHLREPWHPLKDPKPQWLRRPKETNPPQETNP